MTVMTLADHAASAAFIVVDPNHEELAASISGSYITILVKVAPDGWTYAEWCVNPIYHDLGRDGLYGADSASLYDAALDAIRQAVAADEEE
jgi:hypothetical protein